MVAVFIIVALAGVIIIKMNASKDEKAETDVYNVAKGIEAQKVLVSKDIIKDKENEYARYSLSLLKLCYSEDENTMISPFSIASAIAMIANGADADTLNQIETMFGISISDMNQFLKAYADSLPSSEEYLLKNANSIWLNRSLNVKLKDEYLQTTANYFNNDIYEIPFNQETLKSLNNWVKDNTNGMIDGILDEEDKSNYEKMLVLVNAIAFEAKWDVQYEDNDVTEGKFHSFDGKKKKVDMMNSTEYQYIEDEQATGFIKYYKDKKYAFVALLPNEDVLLSDYISNMTGTQLLKTINAASSEKVEVKIPKFESRSEYDLVSSLKQMGMIDAFDASKSNFSKLVESIETGFAISKVIHKTYISVDEKGTKAAAVTAVTVDTAYMEPKTVYLDRPFVYMVIDCENGLPLFIGTVLDI